jgi:hypothetical protein
MDFLGLNAAWYSVNNGKPVRCWGCIDLAMYLVDIQSTHINNSVNPLMN